jgi:chromosome segregation ATPase
MTESVENLILEHLKKIQTEMSLMQHDIGEIRSRIGTIESGVGRLRRDEAVNFEEIIETRHQYDRLQERIERIERRLELT